MLKAYLIVGEETERAHCPDWYSLLQAAKYLGVAPWELLEQSIWWSDIAFKAMTAEVEAQKVLDQHQQGQAAAQQQGR